MNILWRRTWLSNTFHLFYESGISDGVRHTSLCGRYLSVTTGNYQPRANDLKCKTCLRKERT